MTSRNEALNAGLRSNVATNTQTAQVVAFNAWRRRA